MVEKKTQVYSLFAVLLSVLIYLSYNQITVYFILMFFFFIIFHNSFMRLIFIQILKFNRADVVILSITYETPQTPQ